VLFARKRIAAGGIISRRQLVAYDWTWNAVRSAAGLLLTFVAGRCTSGKTYRVALVWTYQTAATPPGGGGSGKTMRCAGVVTLENAYAAAACRAGWKRVAADPSVAGICRHARNIATARVAGPGCCASLRCYAQAASFLLRAIICGSAWKDINGRWFSICADEQRCSGAYRST